MIQASFFLIMRWLHLASAAVIIGGLILFVISATPLRTLDRSEAVDKVINTIEKRYRWLLVASVMGLVVSGVFQWVTFGQAYQDNHAILAVLSVKVLVATALFALLWAFQVETMSGEEAKAWRWTNLALAVTVLLIAGGVRYMRLQVAGG